MHGKELTSRPGEQEGALVASTSSDVDSAIQQLEGGSSLPRSFKVQVINSIEEVGQTILIWTMQCIQCAELFAHFGTLCGTTGLRTVILISSSFSAGECNGVGCRGCRLRRGAPLINSFMYQCALIAKVDCPDCSS
jgi:hypothetical protein